MAGTLALRAPAAALPSTPVLRAALRRWLEQEAAARPLFGAFVLAFGAGILLFFAAEGRPPLAPPLIGATLACGAAVLLRRHLAGFAGAVVAAGLFLGFATGALRLRAVEAPVIQRVTIATLSGFIESVETRLDDARVVMRVHAIEGLATEGLPQRVRVTVRERAPALVPGAFVAARARLVPLPEPVRPGGYDFARDAYFRGIGGVGSLLAAPISVAPPHPAPWSLRLGAGIDAARNALAERIATTVGGPAGAVAAALVTGKRGTIDEETNAALRGAGIYHIVSISGLHMVLAAGAFFWVARAVLALLPLAALTWPVKKIAALVAMAGATAYCIFAGAEVATERSLVMTLVMLGAILADRPALSMRNLGLAALIVMARQPETLLGPSFQMSFAAVAALIAFAPLWHRRRGEGPDDLVSRLLAGSLRAGAAMLGTTLVAGLATAPFAAYHFQTANPLGLIGNALALPLVTFIVMPFAVLGVIALAFGLDRPVWQLVGYAVEQVLAVSAWVSEFPFATLTVPALTPSSLLCFGVALALATLLVTPLRAGALAPAGLALAFAASTPRPDLLVDRSGAGMAVRGIDGRLAFAGRVSSFVGEQWLRADGDGRETDDASLRTAARCDALGCVLRLPDGRAVSLVRDRHAFEEDCIRATVIVTSLEAPSNCRAARVIDRGHLASRGATALRIADGVTLMTTGARDPVDAKPWHVAPRPARPAPPVLRPPNREAAPAGAEEDEAASAEPNP